MNSVARSAIHRGANARLGGLWPASISVANRLERIPDDQTTEEAGKSRVLAGSYILRSPFGAVGLGIYVGC